MRATPSRGRGSRATPMRETKKTPRAGTREAAAESPATNTGGSSSTPSAAGTSTLSRAVAPSATTAMSGNTARYAATCAADMHSWVLAVKQPTSPALPASPSTHAGDAEPTEERRRSSRHSRPASSTPGDVRRRSSTSQVAQLPLEERIGLAELQQIMRAFELPPSNGGGDDSAASSRNSSRRGAPHVRGDGGGGGVGPFRTLEETMFSVDELSVVAAPLPHLVHSPQTASSKGDAQQSRASRRPLSRVRLTPPPPALGLVADPATQPLRQLSQEEFVRVLQGVVPSATLPEIQALLTKAVSETQDTVSWNDLANFLVTRSRQKADLALENQRFLLSGQPVGMRFDDQHGDAITCVAVEPVRRLLVTGCSGGSVRAWSSGSDLAYRGLLLQVDKWIVGLHWGCDQRVLYVVTMDRWVYVLDGTTYEVLRVFHGRGISESATGMTYASETIGTVRISGVPLTKRTPASSRQSGAVHAAAQEGDLPDKSQTPTAPRRVGKHGSSRTGAAAESRDDRMNRLLSSAMQVRRAVRPVEPDRSTCDTSHRSSLAQVESISAALTSGSSGVSGILEAHLSTLSASTAAPSVSRRPSHAVATVYSLTTAAAAEALHQDNTPLTGAGRGPYVAQRVEEGVLTALVDPVTATEFHESAFQEDVLLLGTSDGDVFLFQLAEQHHLPARRVVAARHVLRQLHRGRITKLELLLSLDALVSSGDDGYVRVTSLVTGSPLRYFYASDLPEQHASVSDFALNVELKMLLTIGPERRALVWEWTQPSPIAILDPANSPCCCGAFMGDRLLMVSRDGMLHVYDCKGFRLQQELSLANTAALDRFGTSVGASRSLISILQVDEARQRVLGFGRFPFSLGAKRQVSTGCPERYRGHHAPMLTTLSARPFGQVVTVGTDGVVMTWTPRTGVNEFFFLLSNFSNTSTASTPLRPTAATMDVLQRRLLTGFDGGTMVVWNILNGQVERVLTAATGTAPATSQAAPAPAAAAAAAVSTTTPTLSPSSKPARSGLASTPPTTPTASAAAAAASTAKRDVTAVGSVLRQRVVSYIFALGPRLYVDAAVERNGAGTTTAAAASQGGGSALLGEYSTAPASSWVVPAAFGDVVKLVQLGPQIVGCGTSSGAVLLYNVQSDRQEGAPMWVREAMLSPAWTATTTSGASNGLVVSTNSTALQVSPGDNGFAGGPRQSCVPLVSGPFGGTGGMLASAAALLPSPQHQHHQQQQQPRAVHGGNTLLLASLANQSGGVDTTDAELAKAASSVPAGVVNSRVTRMIPLPNVHPRLLVMGQEDGTLSIWHTMRRVCLGAVNLTAAAGVEDAGQAEDAEWGGGGGTTTSGEPATNLVIDMEQTEGRLLVFGDGEGNVHVCRVRWSVVSDPTEQAAALAMQNPATFAVGSAGSPLSREYTRSTEEAGAVASSGDPIAAERSLPLLQQMERVHVFSSGMTLSSIAVVHADAAASTVPPSISSVANAGTTAAARPSSTASERGPASAEGKANDATRVTSASQRTRKDRDKPRFLILCTGVDHYVRAFNLAGVPIGELGMDEWNVSRPSTFRFMGERTAPPAVPLPCSLAGNTNWQRDSDEAMREKDCYHDYLADLSATLNAKAAPRVSSIRGFARNCSVATGPTARRGFGTTVLLDSPFSPSVRGTARPSATARASRAVDVPLSPEHMSVASAADKSPLNTAASTPAVPGNAEGLAAVTPRSGTVPAAADSALTRTPRRGEAQAESAAHAGRSLNMRLHQNTRYRYESDRRFRGVLKRSYALQLQNRSQESRKARVLSSPHAHLPRPELPSLFASRTSSSTSSVNAATGARVHGRDSGDGDTAAAAVARSSLTTPGEMSEGMTGSSVWSDSAPATPQRRSAGPTRGAAASFLYALEQSAQPPAKPSVKVENEGNDNSEQAPLTAALPRKSLASTVGPDSLRDEPLTLRRTSSVLTDVPQGEAGSLHDGMSLPCATAVNVPPAMVMTTLLAVDGPVTVSLEPPAASYGASVTKRPSSTRRRAPPPAVHAPKPPLSRGRHENQPNPRTASFSSPTVVPRGTASPRKHSTTSITPNPAARDGGAGGLNSSPDADVNSRRLSGVDRPRSASLLSYVSTELERIVRSAQTRTSRDQVAALGVAVPTHPLSMGIAGGSASAAGTLPSAQGRQMSTFVDGRRPSSPVSVMDVYNQVDMVLERRRSKQLCCTPTSEEVASSAEGYLTQVTSRMYIAPVSESSMSTLTTTPRSQRHSVKPPAHLQSPE